MFYKTGVMFDRSFTLRDRDTRLFCSCEWPWPNDLHIRTWYTHIPRRYTGCANMNFLRQCFQKVSFDRQTDRRTNTTDDRNYISLQKFSMRRLDVLQYVYVLLPSKTIGRLHVRACSYILSSIAKRADFSPCKTARPVKWPTQSMSCFELRSRAPLLQSLYRGPESIWMIGPCVCSLSNVV